MFVTAGHYLQHTIYSYFISLKHVTFKTVKGSVEDYYDCSMKAIVGEAGVLSYPMQYML